MPRYIETASRLQGEIQTFLDGHFGKDADLSPQAMGAKCHAARQLGYIVNLAVRCAPRSVQSTVRKNIVQIATRGYCNIGMRKATDPVTGKEYNKISILPLVAQTDFDEDPSHTQSPTG